MESHDEEVGDGPETPPGSHRASSTFQGSLHLNDFMYNEPADSSPRRSSRLFLSSPQGGLAPSGRSSSSSTPHGNDSSPGPRPSRVTKTSAKGTKRKRPSAGYAPPATYAHLPLLPDAITPGLLVLFVGLNPGIETARTGHAYAHPSNLFWKLLFSSGVTPRPCRADEDRDLPRLYGLGFTNIVARPSRNGSELSRAEMDDGVAALHEKARRWRPEAVCVVGKSIWESIWRVRHGRAVGAAFKYGWQDEAENMGADPGEGWPGAMVFVASSTSGLAATLSPAEKQKIWEGLGTWVKKRRAEREAEDGRGTDS